jgi:IS1 family transposase
MLRPLKEQIFINGLVGMEIHSKQLIAVLRPVPLIEYILVFNIPIDKEIKFTAFGFGKIAVGNWFNKSIVNNLRGEQNGLGIALYGPREVAWNSFRIEKKIYASADVSSPSLSRILIRYLNIYDLTGNARGRSYDIRAFADNVSFLSGDESSLADLHRVFRNGYCIPHGAELEKVNSRNHYGCYQSPYGQVKWIGFLHEHFSFLGRLLMCGFWFGLLWWCARLNIHWAGGRSAIGFFLTMMLLAVLALQFITSLIALVNGKSVTQKYLTSCYLCNTVIDMANVLPLDKQVTVIGALAEGSSIRSIERLTGIHRDTIMRLGVRIGKGCEMLLDSKMQDLPCNYLQMDEIWGFIGKKERHVGIDDDPEMGDVWTYCAIDSETKLVPAFKVGKRNLTTTTEFVHDVASRMRNRVQISTDALRGYAEAIEQSFGADVDYGQIVKVYTHDGAQHPERKYSAPSFASAIRRPIAGDPDRELISTSHVERLNATTRLHVKRLSRLTLAFSKKLDNFKAAVGLHFAYYNLVRRHATLRCTPAMAAGVEKDFWTVGDLVEATV